MLSANALLPQRFDFINAVNQPEQLRQLFTPLTGEIQPQLGLTSAVTTITGNVSLVDNDSYLLDFTEAGTTGSSYYSFTASGTVSFGLYAAGSLNAVGNYAFSSVTLTQSAAINWSWLTTDGNGNTLASLAGTDSLTVVSPASSLPDAYFWQALDWNALTQQVLADNGLSLGTQAASTITVTESAGSESYALNLTNGQLTTTGVGSQPMPTFLGSGTQTYNYSFASNFFYQNAGADSFTLAAQGNRNGSNISLSTIAYNETADQSVNPIAGYSFRFGDQGTLTEIGTGTQATVTNSLQDGVSTVSTTTQTYNFSQLQTYNYGESGSADSFRYGQTGSFAAGSFALNTITYNASGNGTYQLNLKGEETSTGSFTSDQAVTGLPTGTLLENSNTSAAGTFASADSLVQAETGSGGFQFDDLGNYSGGNYAFTNAATTINANATFSLNSGNTYSDSSAGTSVVTDYDASHSATNTNSYSATSGSSGSQAQSGAGSYSLSQTGFINGGVYGLTSYVLNSSMGGTYTSSSGGNYHETGSGVGSATGTDPASAGTGFASYLANSNYTYASASTFAQSDAGMFSQATFESGVFAGGSYALNSAVYQQSQTDAWTQTGSDSNSSTGTTAETDWGTALSTNTGGGVNGSDLLSSISYNSINTTGFTSSSADTYAQSGTQSYSLFQAGSFANGSYAFGSVVYQSSGNETDSTTSNGSDTFSTAASGSTVAWSNQGIISAPGTGSASLLTGIGNFTVTSLGTQNSTSVDSWSESDSSVSTFATYQAGQYALASYNLASVNATQSAVATSSLQEFSAQTTTGTDSVTAQGAGSLVSTTTSSAGSSSTLGNGSYVQTGQDTFTSSSAESMAQFSAGTFAQSELGTFSGNSYSFASVVLQSSSVQSSSDQVSGQDASAGTAAVSFTCSASLGNSSVNASANTSATGLNSSTQSGQRLFVQSASDSYNETDTAASTSTLYEAGTSAADNYAFASVAYNETDTSATSLTETQQATQSGTDSWTGSNLSNATGFLGGAQLLNTLTNVNSASTYLDSYQNTSSGAVAQNLVNQSTLNELGTYSGGSYAFSSMTYDSSGSETDTIASTAFNSTTASGTDSVTATSNQTLTSPDAVSSVNLQYSSASSNDSYSQTAAQTSVQSEVDTSNFTMHEEGSLDSTGWTLSLISYTASATASQSLLQTGTSADSGTYSSSANGTSSNVAYSSAGGLYTTQNSGSFTGSAAGSFSDSSVSTFTQQSNLSSTLTQLGTFDPVNGYAFSSVVYQANFASSGATQSLGTSTAYSLSTSNALSTSSSSNLSSAVNSTGNITSSSTTGDNTVTSTQTTSLQSTQATSSLTDSAVSSGTQYQAGVYGLSSYAFTSVAFASTSDESFSLLQSSATATAGTSQSTTTLLGSNNATTTIAGSSSDSSSSLLTNTSTYSSQSATIAVSTFSELSSQTYSQTGEAITTLTQDGDYALASYAFTSIVYQFQANSSVTSQQSDASSFTANSNATFTGQGTNGCFAYSTDSTGAVNSSTNQSPYTQVFASSLIESGNNFVTALSLQQNSATLYEEGQSSLGSTSLSCVVLNQSSVETDTSLMQATTVQTAANSTSTLWGTNYSSTNSANDSTQYSANTEWEYSNGSSTYNSSTQTSVSILSTTAVLSNALYEAGSSTNTGVYSFSSIAYSTSQQSWQSSQQSSVQSFAQGASSFSNSSQNSVWSSVDAAATTSLSAASTLVLTQWNQTDQTGIVTLSFESDSTSSATYDTAGSYNGATNRYYLPTVSYAVDATNSYTSTQISNITTTTANQSSVLYTTLSQWTVAASGAVQCSTLSYSEVDTDSVQNSLQTQSGEGNSAASFSEFGSLGTDSQNNSVLAFSSVDYYGNAYSAGTATTDSINSSTQTNVQSTGGTYTNSGINLGYYTSDPTAARQTSINSITTTVTTQTGSGSSYAYSAATTHLTQDANTSQYEIESKLYSGTGQSGLIAEGSDPGSGDGDPTEGGAGQISLMTQVSTLTSNSSDSFVQAGASGVLINYSNATTVNSVTTMTYQTYSSLASYAHSWLSVTANAANQLIGAVYQSDGDNTFDQQEDQTQYAVQTTNVQNSTQTNTSPSAVTANTTSVALCSSNASWLSGGTYAYSAAGQGDNSTGTFGYNSVVYTENTDSDQTYTAASFNTSTTVTTGTNYNGTATSTKSTSLNCYQASTETLYTAGTSLDSTWNLSSYCLTATDTLIASNSTVTNTSNTYNGINPDRTTFNGYGNSTQSQTNNQQQVSQWDQEGSINNGVFNLSLVSFTSTAQYTTNYYSYSSQAGTSGTYSNTDTSTVNGTLGGNFTETAVGNFLGSTSTTGFGSFNTVTQQGSSYGSYALSQSGAVNGEAYSHSDTLTETTTLYLTGSDNPYNSGGALQAGWNLSCYNLTTTSTEVFADTVKGVASGATINGTVSLIGNSTQATLTQSGDGSSYWGTRGYSYTGNVVQTSSLSAPWPLIFWPAGQHSWFAALFPSTGIAQLPDALKGITQLLQAMPMPSVLGMTTLPTMWSSLATPPMLVVPTPQAYGGWLLAQGGLSGTMLTPTWAPSNSFENWTQMVNWGSVNQAYQDALAKMQNVIGSRNPTTLYGQNAFTAAAAQLGATISGDFWAQLGQLQDLVGGALNFFTAGLSNRALAGLGLNSLVNTSSLDYKVGQVVGFVVMLLVVPGGGFLANTVLVMQVVGNLWNAYDAYRSGDYVGATVSLLAAALAANRLLGSFRGLGSVANAGGTVARSSGLLPSIGSSTQNFLGLSRLGSAARSAGVALVSPTSSVLGATVQGAVWGAALGGLFSGIAYGINWYQTGNGNWTELAKVMAGGAAGGLVSGAIIGGLGQGLSNNGAGTSATFLGNWLFAGIGGGIGGAVQSTVTQWLTTGQVNWTQVQQGAQIGLTMGLATGWIGGLARSMTLPPSASAAAQTSAGGVFAFAPALTVATATGGSVALGQLGVPLITHAFMSSQDPNQNPQHNEGEGVPAGQTVGQVPPGATVVRTDPAGRWVIFDLNGERFIQFDVRYASPLASGPLGAGAGSPWTLAALGPDGNVIVLEGMHRLVDAQNGAIIPPNFGGVPGRPGWLQYRLRGQ